jgi:hypothetical protein
MLGAVAPDVMKATRLASQATSLAPIPPEVERLLKGPQQIAAEPTETETPTETPEPTPTTEV